MIKIDNYKKITFAEFITTFYPDLVPENLSVINHENIKELGLEGIERIPLKEVTGDQVARGDIVLIKSRNEKNIPIVCAYLNPNLAKTLEVAKNTQTKDDGLNHLRTPDARKEVALSIDQMIANCFMKNAPASMGIKTMAGTYYEPEYYNKENKNGKRGRR